MSGVGLYDDAEADYCIAPSDYDTRWDHEGCNFPDRDKLPVMWQRPLNGRHGFICHDACWSVLQVFFPLLQLQVVLVSRLLEVCRSCPVKNMSLLDWGHNYGGLIGAPRAASCLWDESYVEVSAQLPERVLQDARANPFDVPEMQEILDGTRQCPPPEDRFSFKHPIPLRHSGEKDCFARLPPEILQEIAVYLPT